MSLAEVDPDVAAAMNGELSRQRDTLEMIASENFVPRAVLQAQGSVLTNKYAEGYPGRRYYGGCEYVDVVEDIARNRAKELFGADFANVQPHSGSQANFAVYTTLLEPGDTVDASGPFGRFCLMPNDSNRRYLLIATGTGIASFSDRTRDAARGGRRVREIRQDPQERPRGGHGLGRRGG